MQVKSMIYPDTSKEISVCAIGADTLEDLKFPIAIGDNDAGIERYISTDRDTILYRRELFRNIMSFPEIYEFFGEIYDELWQLHEISVKNPESGAADNERLLYSITELRIFTNLINRISEKYAEIKSKITAEGLIVFFDFVQSVRESGDFLYADKGLGDIDDGMKYIKSITVGINLDTSLSASEVGIVSINPQPYVSDTALDKLFRKNDPGREFYCIAPVGLKELGGLTQRTAMSFDAAFYSAMNQVLKSSIKKLKQFFSKMIFGSIAALLKFIPEIDFILRASAYMLSLKKAGMSLTFPEISEKNHITALSNPNLLDKIPLRAIVPSDAVFDSEGRIFILTGPNSGGKSVFIQAVGIAQIMFQTGLPVAAESASCSICDAILTHFNKTTANSIESRLVNETKRLKEILDVATESTLLLFDEMLSSTSAYDATILAGGILKHIQTLGSRCIYATHLHELATNHKEIGDPNAKSKIDILNSRIENGVRNYKIVREKTSNLTESFAKDIFEEYGLGFISG